MEVVKIRINQWRNFRNLHIDVPQDGRLICIVGDNGAGKSNLLELVSYAAHKVGISPGFSGTRGGVNGEEHDFVVAFRLPGAIQKWMCGHGARNLAPHRDYLTNSWDGTIAVASSFAPGHGHEQRLSLGGIDNNSSTPAAANAVHAALSGRSDTHYLFLDADRAYPRVNINPNDYAQAISTDWQAVPHRKNQSFATTKSMYDEWVRYFLGTETRSATEFVQRCREATAANQPQPVYGDIWVDYRNAIRSVLPHLTFLGVDTTQRTIVFRSRKSDLLFHQLSGGEREIAFLVGQVHRFGLKQGLMLLDEPELHLNPDLLRNWISYLSETIDSGQVWVATHSPEAAEVAGSKHTLVLEKDDKDQEVVRCDPIADRPALQLLASTLGTPGFSLHGKRYVFVEGERGRGERDRYYRIFGEMTKNRFIESGNCLSVLRRLELLKDLVQEVDHELVFGGIIDSDFQDVVERKKLAAAAGAHCLGVHEVENLFLHPLSLAEHLKGVGRGDLDVASTLVRLSDQFAGSWILHHVTSKGLQGVPVAEAGARKAARKLQWGDFENDLEHAIQSILQTYTEDNRQQLDGLLKEVAGQYEKVRQTDGLWRYCMGKEVLDKLSNELEYKSSIPIERSITTLWKGNPTTKPSEVSALEQYLSSLV